MTNQTVYLFCEGTSGGLDWTVLDKIKKASSRSVSIQPFGGVGGHSRYAEGFSEGLAFYLKELGTTPDHLVLGFRDRDFDFPVPEVPKLTKAGKDIYAGYRTTLENYLLDTEMFFNFTKSEPQVDYANLFSDLAAVKTLFESSAQDILVFQAARYALGSIRNSKAQQTTNFRDYEEEASPNHVGKYCYLNSKKLPPFLTEEACRRESYVLLDTFQDEASKYSKKYFDEAFNDVLAKFRETSFMEQGAYLIWFQGKTLQSAMQRRLPTGFPMGSYNKYAAAQFDYTKHPDLRELRDKINLL